MCAYHSYLEKFHVRPKDWEDLAFMLKYAKMENELQQLSSRSFKES